MTRQRLEEARRRLDKQVEAFLWHRSRGLKSAARLVPAMRAFGCEVIDLEIAAAGFDVNRDQEEGNEK